MISDTAAYTASPGNGGNVDLMDSVFSSSSTARNSYSTGRSTVSETINTYYIYSFDGRLLAEYDRNGSCVGDYIYSGNRLIAEYKPKTNEYFYYMNDQINSTRIITNGSGNVVFSEAAGPCIHYVDAATGTLGVSNEAVAFHELAEAYGKDDLGMPYMQRGGGTGTHEYPSQSERILIRQPPGFTQFPVSETLMKR